MRTEALYKVAKNNNITLDVFALPESKSLCGNMDNRFFIAIDPDVFSRNSEERVSLAHEIGPCRTGSFYNLYSAFDIRQKHENRADKWAINCLIPEKELNKAISRGCHDVCSLAEYFCVTEDFVKKALKLYKKIDIA